MQEESRSAELQGYRKAGSIPGEFQGIPKKTGREAYANIFWNREVHELLVER